MAHRVHEREQRVRVAESDLTMLIQHHMLEQHDLTAAEWLQVVEGAAHRAISAHLRGVITAERDEEAR